jgi:DNA-binding transcriptional regulator YiaG
MTCEPLTDWLPANELLRKLRRAYPQMERHRRDLELIEKKWGEAVGVWREMLKRWEIDRSQPDPYISHREGQ